MEQAILLYLLKSVLYAGVLTGYYWFGLRNRTFHAYNRFYLLFSVLLSLFLPLISWKWTVPAENLPTLPYFIAPIVTANNDEMVMNTLSDTGWSLSGLQFAWSMLVIVAAWRLIQLVVSGWRIQALRKKYPGVPMADFILHRTNLIDAPFSFFHRLFWRQDIDLHSEYGRQILAHEITHIRQKHSWDKLLIQLSLVFGWFNPFFWIIRRELSMIHEFLADCSAVKQGDAPTLANLILNTLPNRQHILANHFLHSPIKRRLMMIAQPPKTKFGYWTRVAVLPIVATCFMAFSASTEYTLGVNKQNWQIIIDAGHGGQDIGAVSRAGVTESDLTLKVAQKLALQISEAGFPTKVTRKFGQITIPGVWEQAENHKGPSALISLHVDKLPNTNERGISVWIPSNAHPHFEASSRLGTLVLQQLVEAKLLPAGSQLRQRSMKIRTLESAIGPAVLVEMGNMSNEASVNQIQTDQYQSQLAFLFTKAFRLFVSEQQKYANSTSANHTTQQHLVDTTKPTTHLRYQGEKVKSITVNPGEKKPSRMVHVITTSGKEYWLSVDQAKAAGILPPPPPPPPAPVAPSGGKMPPPPPVPTAPLAPTVPAVAENDLPRPTEQTIQIQARRVQSEQAVDGSQTITMSGPINIEVPKDAAITKTNQPALYVIDGKQVTVNEVKQLSPEQISLVQILKGKSATDKYGAQAEAGVVEITTKQ